MPYQMFIWPAAQCIAPGITWLFMPASKMHCHASAASASHPALCRPVPRLPTLPAAWLLQASQSRKGKDALPWLSSKSFSSCWRKVCTTPRCRKSPSALGTRQLILPYSSPAAQVLLTQDIGSEVRTGRTASPLHLPCVRHQGCNQPDKMSHCKATTRSPGSGTPKKCSWQGNVSNRGFSPAVMYQRPVNLDRSKFLSRAESGGTCTRAIEAALRRSNLA